MKTTIFLHSTTGNTRVVTRFAAAQLRAAGHDCHIHDIVKHPEPPPLDDLDLIGIAAPTMYFRATFAMERFVGRMRPPAKPKPAFLLATAAGEPGAQFSVLAELLAPKDIVTLGAHWVMAPSNWPPHLIAVKLVGPATPLIAAIVRRVPASKWVLGTLWPQACEPQPKDRETLRVFLADIIRQAATGDLAGAPSPKSLLRSLPGADAMGRLSTPEMAAKATRPRIHHKRCTACGVCVCLCPVGCISRDHDDEVPRVGANCTGCWACYNHCPEGAISGWMSPRGLGRYPGPSRAARELFRA